MGLEALGLPAGIWVSTTMGQHTPEGHLLQEPAWILQHTCSFMRTHCWYLLA